MAKYVKGSDQVWEPADVVGVQMERCLLWEGRHNVFAGLFRVPQGMRLPAHRHGQWVQILILSGRMQVEEVGAGTHTIAAGEYYFVEPGDAHVETALEDTLLLVVADEERVTMREQAPLF